MVLALSIIGVLAGIALGLLFKVFVLAPAITLAVIFALIVGVARGETFGSIIVAMLIIGTAIQLGYFVGTFLAKRIQ
jgi:hypothetical protein